MVEPDWSSRSQSHAPRGGGDPGEELDIASPLPRGSPGIEGEVGSARIRALVRAPQIPVLLDQVRKDVQTCARQVGSPQVCLLLCRKQGMGITGQGQTHTADSHRSSLGCGSGISSPVPGTPRVLAPNPCALYWGPRS